MDTDEHYLRWEKPALQRMPPHEIYILWHTLQSKSLRGKQII